MSLPDGSGTILYLQIEDRQLDITDGYENWLNIAMALANEFGESGRGFFHRASMYNAGYEAAECDKKYMIPVFLY